MILVSGGSRGIGQAIVMAALSAGYEILAVARGTEDLQELATLAGSNRLSVLPADLSTSEGCEMVAQWINNRNIRLEALVNNAGAYTAAGLTDERDPLSALLDLNLLAAHRLTRLLLGDGLDRIITIGSVAALDLPKHMPAYAVSKYALHGWHQMLKKELHERSTKCSLIIPGATLTSSWAQEAELPLRILRPEQVAELVLQCLEADEGLTLEIRP
ncbi:hypothetical protein CEQ90_09355 [Lewinellaceae bacterium SD302]|nr:hypothetical protein CEQ90_09355 [Lewinellaceae bacterium SD302]